MDRFKKAKIRSIFSTLAPLATIQLLFLGSLSGKRGIIVFEVSSWSDASGHVDLWNGSKVVGSDYGEQASILGGVVILIN